MRRAKAVQFFDKIKLIIEVLQKYEIPFDLININDENGRETAGLRLKDCRWLGNKLVENEPQVDK